MANFIEVKVLDLEIKISDFIFVDDEGGAKKATYASGTHYALTGGKKGETIKCCKYDN